MSNLEKALGIAGRKHSDVTDEHMVDILAIVNQAWGEVEEMHKYISELEAKNERLGLIELIGTEAMIDIPILRAELAKARKVIEQVKHDGDTFDHLRGFAGYIKAANYLVGED